MCSSSSLLEPQQSSARSLKPSSPSPPFAHWGRKSKWLRNREPQQRRSTSECCPKAVFHALVRPDVAPCASASRLAVHNFNFLQRLTESRRKAFSTLWSRFKMLLVVEWLLHVVARSGVALVAHERRHASFMSDTAWKYGGFG